MILIVFAILLALAFLLWLWKVPIKKMAQSMQKNGSSAFEAYVMIILLVAGSAIASYFIYQIL